MDSNAIIEAARECLGTPFLHQGRIPGKGLDCVGLVRYPAVKLGITDADYIGYPREPNKTLMGELLDKYLVRIDRLEPGCILWLKIVSDPQHLALYTGDTIIHALNRVNGKGSVVEHGFREPWPNRVFRMYKYKWQP